MGILQYIKKEDFYKKVDPRSFSLGQICWIVVPIINKIPQILDVERERPEEHESVGFKIRSSRSSDFRARRTLPLKGLNLQSNEEMLIQRAKQRPGIIIATGVDAYPDISKVLKREGKSHLQEDSIFLIPCYGVQTEEEPFGFPPEMVARIRCLMYRQFMFLPKKAPLTKDSIARIDRIQVVVDPKERMAIEATDLCLSEEALSILVSLFQFCISGDCDDNLESIRQLTKECYVEIKPPT